MAKSKNLESQAYQYMKEKIDTRQWLPNTHITELDLSKILGISRTPIRRAFIHLQEEGILKIEPHRGAVVQEPIIDNKGFQDRIGFIELILNQYLHELQIREIVFDTTELERQVEYMSSLTGSSEEKAFYTAVTVYFKELAHYSKNTYHVTLLMDTLRSIIQQEGGEIQTTLSISRDVVAKHLTNLNRYLMETQYALARKEVRILMNQLSLALLQGI